MSLNYKEISKLLNIFKNDIIGSSISKITQINNNQLYIVFHSRKDNFHTIFNIEQSYSFFAYGKPIEEAPKNPYNFTSSLRKYLKGKRVIEINFKNNERIFSIEFQNLLLIFEMIDRNGNIFLIEKDSNRIISSLKKRNSKLREELPGKTYKELPIRKINTKFEIRDELFSYHLNPLISVYCFYNCKKINNFLSQLIKEFEKKVKKLKKLLYSLEKEYTESLNYESYNNIGKAILTNQNYILEEVNKLKLKDQQSKKSKNKNKNDNNKNYEINIKEKENTSSKNIKIFDYTANKEINLLIDKTTNPIQLANNYFTLSKKFKRKIKEIEKRKNTIVKQISSIENKINKFNKINETFLCNLTNKFYNLKSIDEISTYFKDVIKLIFNDDTLNIINKNNILFSNKTYFLSSGNKSTNKKDLNNKTYNKNKNQYIKSDKYYIFTLSSGKIALVGKSAKHNLEILKKHARGEDYWFHTRDFPGSYVIIKSKELNQTDIKEASNLAIYFSKARNNKKADIVYTKCKYLKPVKNGKGKVIYTKNKNFYVELDQDLINSIKGKN